MAAVRTAVIWGIQGAYWTLSKASDACKLRFWRETMPRWPYAELPCQSGLG